MGRAGESAYGDDGPEIDFNARPCAKRQPATKLHHDP
jgi:hypothetical protein